MEIDRLPTIVLGAGPVGLAAAAHLSRRGLPFLVLERGHSVGENMLDWGQIRMFSPWRYAIDSAAVALLGESWPSPDLNDFPTGSDMVDLYLEPLAELSEIAPWLHLNHEVVSIHRLHMGRSTTPERADSPFVVTAATDTGLVDFHAAAIVDATGTWSQQNAATTTGSLAPSESAAAKLVSYGAPDVAGKQRSRYTGKRIAVIGGGHTAQNTLRSLSTLQDIDPATKIHWLIRPRSAASLFGTGEADGLSNRAALGSAARDLVESGAIQAHTGFLTEGFSVDGDTVRIHSIDGATIVVDEVIVCTGQHPDHTITSELQLDFDPVTQATRQLGPLIDPNIHSCATVKPHGHREVSHPEPNFYTVGMKSYGRAPTFLLVTGYEQVRSVVAAIAGDMEAADNVSLELPESGVCGVPTQRLTIGSGPVEASTLGGCC
ncbi:MAG: NAD(P)-binding domain-containing protein [Acidobacteria bacterium]|nr:NAD(P)-binding domain-containing protein [Acidobacteriota bacterium]